LDERSDRDLVTASCGGDRTAYAGLVRRHYGHVLLVCFGVLGNVHDAEDVAQDALIRGFVQIRQLRAGDQFGGWVAAIARNLSINQLRKRKTREKAVGEWSAGSGAARVAGIGGMGFQPTQHRQDADATKDRGQGVPNAEFRVGEPHDARDTSAFEDLERAVARLPWDLRLPLVMHYLDGQDVKTVAQRLEMSPSGVYLKLRTAIKELQQLLTAKGDTP
jgi:RNA polymerase sigma-70 factor (ECF subfamily)